MNDADPEKIYHNLVTLGEDWAQADAAASMLEETRTSLRAKLTSELLPEKGSVAKALVYAEATEAYSDHVKSAVKARRIANVAKVKYDSAKVWVDLMRSKEATKRAEMTMR